MVTVACDLLDHIAYRKEIDRLYDKQADRDARWAAVEEVINEMGAYVQRRRNKASMADFLTELTVNGIDETKEKESQLKRNAIVLMTLHAAKGLEFRAVYMVGMEEGLLPHRRSVEAEGAAIEEERRLCYVGMTRAEDRLTLSMALTRRKWGRPVQSDPSRFLGEIMGIADKSPSLTKKRPVRRRGSQT